MASEVLATRVVDAPVDVVRRLFERDWVAELEPHPPEGLRANARLHAVVGGASATKRVAMTATEPQERVGRTVLIVSWHAEPLAAAFPRMEAIVELVRLRGGRTEMTFWGRYEPPLGAFGRAVDRILARRVARSTVESFVEAIARAATRPSPRQQRTRARRPAPRAQQASL